MIAPLSTPFLQAEVCKEFPGLVVYTLADFGNHHLGKPARKVYVIERTGRSIDQGLHTVPQLWAADARRQRLSVPRLNVN